MLINITVRQLQAFRIVAEMGSFSEASARLHLSQPALSTTIRKLESHLGTRVFDRTTRHVALTPAGHELLRLATRLIDEFESVTTNLEAYLAGRRGQVVVAALPSLAAMMLPSSLAAFKAKYPAVDVLIRDTLHDQIVEMVETGAADFGMTVQPARGSELDFTPLVVDRFVMVCRPDHPLARLPVVTWAQMVRHPLITMARTSSVRQHIDAACAQAGIESHGQYDAGHLATVGALIREGLGIATLPSLATPLLRFANLVEVPVTAPKVERTMGIVRRSGRSPSVLAAALMDLLLERHPAAPPRRRRAARGKDVSPAAAAAPAGR